MTFLIHGSVHLTNGSGSGSNSGTCPQTHYLILIFFCYNFVLKFYLAGIISVCSTHLWEKRRIRRRIRICQKTCGSCRSRSGSWSGSATPTLFLGEFFFINNIINFTVKNQRMLTNLFSDCTCIVNGSQRTIKISGTIRSSRFYRKIRVAYREPCRIQIQLSARIQITNPKKWKYFHWRSGKKERYIKA